MRVTPVGVRITRVSYYRKEHGIPEGVTDSLTHPEPRHRLMIDYIDRYDLHISLIWVFCIRLNLLCESERSGIPLNQE